MSSPMMSVSLDPQGCRALHLLLEHTLDNHPGLLVVAQDRYVNQAMHIRTYIPNMDELSTVRASSRRLPTSSVLKAITPLSLGQGTTSSAWCSAGNGTCASNARIGNSNRGFMVATETGSVLFGPSWYTKQKIDNE